jgi:phage terminase large subunit GpA-like protein
LVFKPKRKIFRNLGEVVIEAAKVFDPPERLTPAETAEKYRYVYQPGAYVGPWRNKTVPYMVEPMDVFASRSFSGEVFVGPAQTGKTDALLVNTVAYTVLIQAMDTIIFCPSQSAARDFSTRRIDRLHRYSPEVGKHLLKDRDSDNKYDKHYDTGIILSISWPSKTELAGRPIGRVILTDRDRMDDDVEGEGDPFDLGSKRTTTFGSFAMCCAESSPSRADHEPEVDQEFTA